MLIQLKNERHRHLEAWQCDLDGCYHRCYRRDNFIQHLVREHRLPDRSIFTKSVLRTGIEPGEVVSRLIDRCRQESPNKPSDEPCRFCGASCTTWKELSVHLAEHMQKICLPILRIISGAVTYAHQRKHPQHTPKPLDFLHSMHSPPLSAESNSRRSSTSSTRTWDSLPTPMTSVSDAGPIPLHGGRPQRESSSDRDVFDQKLTEASPAPAEKTHSTTTKAGPSFGVKKEGTIQRSSSLSERVLMQLDESSPAVLFSHSRRQQSGQCPICFTLLDADIASSPDALR